MAAAIIPIIAAAAPLITPLIQRLVMGVEHLFGAKTGPTKLDAVVNAVIPIVQQLATAGKIPGSLDINSITAMVESVVQALKAQGILNPDTATSIVTQPLTAPAAGSNTYTVKSGTLQIMFG